MTEEKNNKLAFMVGGGLILIVIILSVLRGQPFNRSSNSTSAVQNTADESNNPNTISSDQLAQKILDKENIKIIDIRDGQSFQTEHILDSANVDSQNLAVYVANTTGTNNFVLVDYDGTVAPQIINALPTNNGDVKIYFLTGGFSAWTSQYEPTISGGDPNSFTDQAKVKYITSDDLKKTLERNTNLYIIDVRVSSDYAAGHIKDAVNIPLDELEKRRSEIPIGKQVILYDNDTLSAFSGAVRLFDAGIFGALVVSDGFPAWTKKGYEVVK